jgi:hypothetical protein
MLLDGSAGERGHRKRPNSKPDREPNPQPQPPGAAKGLLPHPAAQAHLEEHHAVRRVALLPGPREGHLAGAGAAGRGEGPEVPPDGLGESAAKESVEIRHGAREVLWPEKAHSMAFA